MSGGKGGKTGRRPAVERMNQREDASVREIVGWCVVLAVSWAAAVYAVLFPLPWIGN